MVWLLRYPANLRRAVKHRKSGPMPLNKAASIEPITIEEITKAEREILTHVQKESFKEEIAALKVASVLAERAGAAIFKKAQVKKSSRIFKLDPQLTDGLLLVGGWLERAGCKAPNNSTSLTLCHPFDYQCLPSHLRTLRHRTCTFHDQRKALDCEGKRCSVKDPQ